MTSHASLSGVQPKLAIVEHNGGYRPTNGREISTHIAKFSSAGHPDLVFNEYLTTQAFCELLPKDEVAAVHIGDVMGQRDPALIIERFDRVSGNRIHFEEFNQLLNLKSSAKYDGSYRQMADWMVSKNECIPTEKFRLFQRVLAGILLGNTDMHFKNFAMFHTSAGVRLTPSYDQVGACLYNYKSMALSIGGSRNVLIGDLNAKHIVVLGQEFGLSVPAIQLCCDQLEKNRFLAKEVISNGVVGSAVLKNNLITQMEKRWNGTFASIGNYLSKRP